MIERRVSTTSKQRAGLFLVLHKPASQPGESKNVRASLMSDDVRGMTQGPAIFHLASFSPASVRSDSGTKRDREVDRSAPIRKADRQTWSESPLRVSVKSPVVDANPRINKLATRISAERTSTTFDSI